jgi:hypothetical protein
LFPACILSGKANPVADRETLLGIFQYCSFTARSFSVKNIHVFFISLALFSFLFFAAGCSNIPQEEAANELVPITTIGILPAQPARITIQPADTQTREQLETGATVMNSLLSDYFADNREVRFISQTDLEGLQPTELGQALYLAKEAGQQLHYDAVLVTEISRYQTRTGSEYAVNSPASVAFSLKLLAVSSGRVIWSADFDQTQQPLFGNILSSRSTGSGFRWLTAAELTEAGLTKKLNSCPYLVKD